ncbi:MAG TPA: hypothetical protein VLJ76_02320 [Gaiellaceae bacterium]|nr:hypothetical protein [Gaiellaceae bacterium]
MTDPQPETRNPNESELDIDPEVVADLEVAGEPEQQVRGGAMCKNANSGASGNPPVRAPQ